MPRSRSVRIAGRKVLLRELGLSLGAALLLIGLVVLIYRILTGTEALPKKAVPDVVTLRLVQLPPPPPPPPPPPKMVEQPKLKEPEFKPEQPVENRPPTPKQAANPAPKGPPALDVKGGGPGDAFNLAGHPGGQPFGGGGSGGGSRFGWYAALIQLHARETLQKQSQLHGSRYKVVVQVWLSPDGHPERVELVNSTGKSDVDQTLKRALEAMSRIPQPPPQDMPEPVILQVSSS